MLKTDEQLLRNFYFECIMMIRVLFFMLVLSPQIWGQTKSQMVYNRNDGNHKFFPSTLEYNASGWILSGGLTKMFSFPSENIETTIDADSVVFDLQSPLKFYAEIGRYKIFKFSPFIRYLDYGVNYKGLSANQNERTDLLSSIQPKTNAFYDHHVGLHFNLNNVIEIKNPLFIQNSLGVNVNYAFSKKRARQSNFSTQSEAFPEPVFGQLHYKFSVGLFASKKLLLIPGVEIPVLSIWPFNVPYPKLTYFHSDFYPVIFSLKFMFLRDPSKDCPPVFSPGLPDGYQPGVD